ncbi:sestrin homolog isoform X2 [Sitophilus oryzae]|uniref:Sestrin homolog isoform X2 n=1 Tax=Sitophilus oryzae TaxID=7048 RepID=A0A6J2YA72_SITOR|nr:sestrin homolog isoform X2 [Sitophilus oryzae]
MFVQTNVTASQKRSAANPDSTSSLPLEDDNESDPIKLPAVSDELMLDLDRIYSTQDTEIQELALDVVSKLVESWLDPNNFVSDQKCDCKDDISDRYDTCHVTETKKDESEVVESETKSQVKKSDCKRSNGDGHSMSSSVTFEKRPRCNTGDETVSKSTIKGGRTTVQYFDLVALQLPIILRLCFACPFGHVRRKCRRILDMVQDRGLPIPVPLVYGPSKFIPSTELPFLGTCNDKTHPLFVDAFLQNNRLDHVSQVMGYHPVYLEQFLKAQNYILRGDGPLPFVYRHYIAIMAAGRHQCSYLIALQKHEFMLQGGDENWLRGLKYIPQKLRNLYDINKILAHRPWLLKKSHIEKLTKCGKDSWSLAEVVHAIVILAHFHSLCCFAFSSGANEELDQAGGYQYPAVQTDTSVTRTAQTPSPSSNRGTNTVGNRRGCEPVGPCPPSPTEPEVGITTLMQRMKTLSEQTEECTPGELAKRFENIEVQSAELNVVGAAPAETPADISYFIDDPTFQYQDFAKRGESDIHTFRVQDYSWDDHGYSTVNRLYNDVGTLLDGKFRTAYHLTYYTMGGRTDVDTSRFRRAIWNYIQALLGIRHDDYDYGEINALVERSLKTFIKSACCYPERVTKKEYDRVMREFEHSEKVHVNLMVLESRMQAELLYALRTVNRYMT